MITCPECKKELEEGTKFCDGCGAPVPETAPAPETASTPETAPAPEAAPAAETIFCPNCGEQTSAESAFCEKCGAPLAEEGAAGGGKQNPFKRIPKKALLIGGVAVVALVLVVLAASLLGGGKKGNSALYLKDSELTYVNLAKKKPMELTSRMASKEYADRYGDAAIASVAYSYTGFSEDGKRVFFPDKLEADSRGVTLYYRDLNKAKGEPEKVDSDVFRYAINPKGTQVVYLKTDGTLCFSDLKDKEKIDNNVSSFYATEDLKKVGYLDEDRTFRLYYPNSKKEEVKLAKDVSSIEKVSEDLSTVYYTKSDQDSGYTLYKQVEGKDDKEKIASDVYEVIAVYDSGEVYYLTTTETTAKTLMDYVDDDLAAADEALTEPEYPTYPDEPEYPSMYYPYEWEYDSDAEYEAAKAEYDAAHEAYDEAYDAWQETRDRMYDDYQNALDNYWAKEDRDSLRNYLREETLSDREYTLHYFNGKEDVVLTESMAGDYTDATSFDKAVLVLPVNNDQEITKSKFSELYALYRDNYDYYYVYDQIQSKNSTSAGKYVAVGGTLTALEAEEASNFRISPDGNTVYYTAGESSDLYKVAVGKTVGAPEEVDSDISTEMTPYFISDDKLVYFKDVGSNDVGDLYVNGVEIDSDVFIYNVTETKGTLLYFIDYEDGVGTLRTSKNGKATTVADDVRHYLVTDADTILYLDDYSMKSGTGTLNQYKGGKGVELDDDVSTLIRSNKSFMKGGY